MLMRYEIIEGKRQLTKVQTTFFEFVEGSNREGNVHLSSDSSGSTSFYGNIKSYEAMYDACYSGLNVKKMMKATADLSSLVNHEVETPRKAIVGEAFNAAAYAAGHPYHYYKDSDEYGKPRVHLTYSTNAVAGVRSPQFIRHGAALCAIANEIAEQVDVKISLYITNVGVLGGNGCQVITIKDYDEVIDIARVAATAHPSFFHRIGFSWFENASRLIDKRCRSGYGGSQTGIDRHRVISDEDFKDWVGAANDEMLVDFPAPDEDQFEDDDVTAYWIKTAMDKISESIEKDVKHCKLFQL